MWENSRHPIGNINRVRIANPAGNFGAPPRRMIAKAESSMVRIVRSTKRIRGRMKGPNALTQKKLRNNVQFTKAGLCSQLRNQAPRALVSLH